MVTAHSSCRICKPTMQGNYEIGKTDGSRIKLWSTTGISDPHMGTQEIQGYTGYTGYTGYIRVCDLVYSKDDILGSLYGDYHEIPCPSTSVQGERTRPSVHKAPQQGAATRPSPNSMPTQVESTRPSVSTGPKQREATRPRPNHTPKQTINAELTQSSKAGQGDAAQPPPTFSLYQKRTTHPPSSTPLIRKKHPASCYLPPHLNRAQQTKKSRLNFRDYLESFFSSQQRLNRPAINAVQ